MFRGDAVSHCLEPVACSVVGELIVGPYAGEPVVVVEGVAVAITAAQLPLVIIREVVAPG